jgi:hypothetical protein
MAVTGGQIASRQQQQCICAAQHAEKTSCKFLHDGSASNMPAGAASSFLLATPCSIPSNLHQHRELLLRKKCRWYVPASAGPPEDGPSTQLWVYRSTVDVVRDTQAGLAGPLIIARPGALNAEGRPADVDREIYMMLQVGCFVW